jgi:hypothetical protein
MSWEGRRIQTPCTLNSSDVESATGQSFIQHVEDAGSVHTRRRVCSLEAGKRISYLQRSRALPHCQQ